MVAERRLVRDLGAALLTAVVYLLAARYVVSIDDPLDLGALFWPGAGISTAALLLTPRRAWPYIVVAVGVAEFANDSSLAYGAAASGWWAAANMIVPLVGALLIRHWAADQLWDVSAALRFALAAFAAPVLGGAVGAFGTLAAGSEVSYPLVAAKWAIGDGLGILTVTPLVLSLFRRESRRSLYRAELLLAVLLTVAATLVVFSSAVVPDALPIAYLVLPPMLWAATRLRVGGAAVVNFLVAQIVYLFTLSGQGPFALEDRGPMAVSSPSQIYLVTITVTVLLLAARTAERDALRELADARAQFLSAVSHELRTPLTPIIGFGELLMRDPSRLSDRERTALEAILRNAHHLIGLVDDLLVLTRSRRRAPTAHPESVELVPFLSDLIADQRYAEVEVDGRVPAARAWVDPVHLRQITMNLLSNAFKYGRAPIQVEVDDVAGQIEVAVSDSGEGVPQWFVPHIFEEFAQATVGDTRPTSGLGLGLTIAADLTRTNHGTLRYEPNEPTGARFVLTLPSAV